MFRRLLLVFLFSLCTQTLLAGTSDRINGVADFLIDRAQDNYLYIFEHKIKENKNFACYFPSTYSNLEQAGIKELLLFDEKLWEDSLQDDLDVLLTRSSAHAIERTFALSKLSGSIWGSYIELLGKLELRYGDGYVRLNSLPIGAMDTDPKLVETVNQFYTTQLEINEALLYFAEFEDRDICQTPVVGFADFKQNVRVLFELDGKLKETIELFKSYFARNRIRFVEGAFRDLISSLESTLQELESESGELVEELTTLANLVNAFESNNSFTYKVLATLRELDKRPNLDIGSVKKYVLFFAQVRDAESPEQVAEILRAYTLPAVSFFEKRKKDVLNINAYLGVAGIKSDVPSGETEGKDFAVYAPIGLEYSWSTSGNNSIGLLLAPFDFGYPVTLKLEGTSEDVDFDEIVAPSIALNYGFEDYPLALGVGFQRGRSFVETDTAEKRVFLHLSFDMPLFTLF